MTEPINQHHVPQTYLRNFSSRKKDDYYVWTWDNRTKKIFNSNIENVAVERHFYTIDNLQDKYVWETFYAKTIEPLMNRALSNVINRTENILVTDRAVVLSNELKKELAIIMVCQLFRSKHSREFTTKIYKREAPVILEHTKSLFGGKGNSEVDKYLEAFPYSENLFRLSVMESVTNPEQVAKIASMLFERYWILYRIIGEQEFITSDNPVMFMNRCNLDVTPFSNGIVNEQTVVYYPISPKVLLALYSKESLLGMLECFDNRVVFLDGLKEQKMIRNINSKQKEQCNRQVFAKSENILSELVERLI